MTISLKPLDRQVMVITGASSGIGLVTARAAAARGVRLVLAARGAEALDDLAEEIAAGGGEAIAVVADVGVADEVERVAARAIEHFGRIDTWVSDAGVTIYGKLLDTPLDEHEQLFRTNYFGTVNSAKAAIPYLKRQGGALIVVASIASDLPAPMMGAYSASKHAVKAFVEVLRMELAEAGAPVSVSMVKPSGVHTPISDHAASHAGAGLIPPPAYAPELVADTILACAERPIREITVGGVGRAQVLFGTHFKRARDLIAPWLSEGITDPSKAQPQPSNLFEPTRDGRAHSMRQQPKTFSLYTTLALRPWLTAMLGVGAVLAGGAALRAGDLKRRGRR